ncbi:MAG: PilZ domain-containing protein [Candidatus Omnitrophota bacterium]|nr:MAG: PilZ domain-containing protein [Candidatus Omnitrophota bacterium]
MENSEDQEKRKYFRIDASYVVSYRARKVSPDYNISQTKNISQGGAVFTTNRAFVKGMFITLVMKLPFLPGEKLKVEAEVVDSKKLGENLYDTRVKFIGLSEDLLQKFGKFIEKNKP